MDGRDLDGEPIDVRVELRWDDYNTALFVEKLFRHVRREELTFDLEARPGPVETTFSLAVANGMEVEIVESIARYLLRRVSRADRNLHYPEVIVFVDGDDHEFTVREETDVRAIVERAHEKVRDEDQRDLHDFSRRRGGER